MAFAKGWLASDETLGNLDGGVKFDMPKTKKRTSAYGPGAGRCPIHLTGQVTESLNAAAFLWHCK